MKKIFYIVMLLMLLPMFSYGSGSKHSGEGRIWPVKIWPPADLEPKDSFEINVSDLGLKFKELLALNLNEYPDSIDMEMRQTFALLFHLGWDNSYLMSAIHAPYVGLTRDVIEDALQWFEKHEKQITRSKIYQVFDIWRLTSTKKAIFNDEYFDSLLVELSRLRIIDEPQDSTK